MIDVILVPLDGSTLAEAALPYAVAVQRAFESELLLLRVVGRTEGSNGSVEWRLCQAEARSYLDEVARRVREEGVDAEAIITAGKPSEAILEAIREREADLVVLCTHGAGGPSQFELSGTVHKVLSVGDTSVLLVRAGEGPSSGMEARLERILVPMDGSARSEWALCLAASIARSSGAELLLLQVLPRPEGLLPAKEHAEVERLLESSRKNAEDGLARCVENLEAPDLKIRSDVIVAPSVPRAIDAAAAREHVSLVVLSAHGGTPNDAWPYGSVSGALVHHGTTPVLVFQDAPARHDEESPRRSRWGKIRSDSVWTT